MQILESSMLGLRAARLVFTKSRAPVVVTLFPMVHVGEQAFYDVVYADALSHDVLLIEGIRSPIVTHLMRSYRWIGTSRLSLVVQPRLPATGNGGARIVVADLPAEEFHAEWRKIPLWLRLLMFICAPMVGLHRRLLATRETLADGMSLEDRKSSDEILSWEPQWAAYEHCVGGARDARLVQCLRTELDRADGQANRIAIVYGASHMRAVVRELVNRGYVCTGSSWQTIFSL